jgi:uncharacterized protein YceK
LAAGAQHVRWALQQADIGVSPDEVAFLGPCRSVGTVDTDHHNVAVKVKSVLDACDIENDGYQENEEMASQQVSCYMQLKRERSWNFRLLELRRDTFSTLLLSTLLLPYSCASKLNLGMILYLDPL